jgi:general secretion pathway protein L
VTAVRSRIEAATAGADVLAAAQRDIGDPLETLASLTDLLPDDTFLTDLSLTGRKLTINGQSASAAKLIGLLSTEPSLGNPSFVAPVTRLETSHTDLFSIRADVIR